MKLNNEKFEKQMVDLIKFAQESIRNKIFVKQKSFKINYDGLEINLHCDFPGYMHNCYGGG
jgi:hypothetical protein